MSAQATGQPRPLRLGSECYAQNVSKTQADREAARDSHQSG